MWFHRTRKHRREERKRFNLSLPYLTFDTGKTGFSNANENIFVLSLEDTTYINLNCRTHKAPRELKFGTYVN